MELKNLGKTILIFGAFLTLTTTTAYAEEYPVKADITYESTTESISVNNDIIIEPLSVIDCTNISARTTNILWNNSYNAYSVEKTIVLNWRNEDNIIVNVKVKNNGNVPIRLGAYNGSAVGGSSDIKLLTIPAYSTKVMTINGNEIQASLNEDIWIGSVLFKLQDANFEGDKINFDITATVTK